MATVFCLKTLNFPGFFVAVCFELKSRQVPEEQKQVRSKTVNVRLNCLPEFSIDFGNKLLKIVNLVASPSPLSQSSSLSSSHH